MYAVINQIQSTEKEQEERNDDVGVNEYKEPVQEPIFTTYYNLNFEQAQDFACFTNNAISTPPNPFKKRNLEAVDGGGARVVRATGRKDRHSKVTTARGPRDRRLRLAPTTAIEFYDVQDRLGYDRPSKAIDWLIKEASAAIDALDAPRSSVAAAAAEAESRGGFCFSQLGMKEKEKHFINVGGRVANSGFSGFSGEAAPPSSVALHSVAQVSETSWEMARLQKMFAWNSVNESCIVSGGGGGAEFASHNSPAAHAEAQAITGPGSLLREPLQSSNSNYNYSWITNNDFAGFNFSNELSN